MISVFILMPGMSRWGATLFLAGADHGRYEKGKRRLEMQYFKTAASRRKADFNGLVVYASAAIIKRKEPINRVSVGCGLSALRLCVWLSDNCRMKLLYLNDRFVFAPQIGQSIHSLFMFKPYSIL